MACNKLGCKNVELACFKCDHDVSPKGDFYVPENPEIGESVTVYCRYLFAVPVRGIIKGVASHEDRAFQVDFYTNNPGGRNVNKHDGKYFHREQCRIDGAG